MNGVNDLPQKILLQSEDHAKLLNVIDSLRSAGIGRYVHLPQLIVCGDQSSGKSSVLEAVSGIRFPTKENLCTRFATELVLRRGNEEKPKVEIIPGSERPDDEKQKLKAFSAPIADVADVPNVIEAAKTAMGLDKDARSISDDILRVEICGPHQSHLTLVDLPGHRMLPMISSLVNSYMKNRRSIILAVVSAKNDLANQIITKLARNHDPKGLRTLGIITKPDTLHRGSENEKSFVDLASNEDIVFRLGWHVLRNRDYQTRDSTAEERDEKEKEFFSEGAWTSLPPSILGIGALKPRLSAILRDQIISELPDLRKDVEEGIKTCERTLERVGPSRSTVNEQWLHLIRISQLFTSLVQASIDGVHRLRAVVSNILGELASDMRKKGHKRTILDDDSTPDDSAFPQQIRRDEFTSEVHALMKRSKGRELPGTFNPLIIGDLFYEQASQWEQIILGYAERILDATQQFLKLTLAYCADDTTQQAVQMEIIAPAMESCTDTLKKKILEILQPHKKGHPITYNHYFIDNVQKIREKRNKRDTETCLRDFFALGNFDGNRRIGKDFSLNNLLAALFRQTEQDMDRYAASEAICYMEAYYKVAMKTVVDNFAVLAIEQCILKKLPLIFNPEVVTNLDDKTLEAIAAETTESKVERSHALEKLKFLSPALQNLKRLAFRRGGHYSDVIRVKGSI
ncbi:interferon-induced GTP-binding protein Mx2 [Coccidioides immitis H538.4]|uniref:Interferon-induced GTP-binding protein Mx2 n=1 Tax=Coccidioides immitis H538.4 TaxID=396776 RepID=A0A0J8S346_COCIT|nr:interferon-induced GTP-binding protein Mx2 [Coccidioides immitis H538.4]